MASVRLFYGPHRSGRRDAVNQTLLDHWDEALLIVPTRAYAGQRTEEIIDSAGLPGVWNRPVLTFQDFVSGLLRGTGFENFRIDDLEERILLERAVARLYAGDALGAIGPAARTQGFLSHAKRIIAQLKQSAVDPREFRERVAGRPGSSEVDTVIAELYSAYQNALTDAKAYDLQGMYWMADLLCKEARPTALDGISVVLLDAFDDFTSSEFRLIQSIAPHLDELVFGLNYSEDPNRKDLYAVTKGTLDRIHESFSPSVLSFGETDPVTVCEFASSNLFWRDKPGDPSTLTPDLKLQACHDSVHEVETLARQIKALLVDEEVPPEQIAVVSRDLDGMAGPLRDVFREFGIPATIDSQPTLAESAIAAFLLRFFEALDGWNRDAVLDVLTAPWFAPPGEEVSQHSRLFPMLARKGRIISGHSEWNDRLQHLEKRLAEGAGKEMEDLLRRVPAIREACASLLTCLDTLSTLAEHVPAKGTIQSFAEGIDALIDALGIPSALSGLQAQEARDFESEALSTLRSLLSTLWRWGRQDAAPLERSAFLLHLIQAFSMTPVRMPAPDNGVACLDLESIRHRHFEYVFFARVNEGITPTALPLNAIYSESDVGSLRAAGIELEDARTHANRELLLFHRILDVPTKQLVLSWHTIAQNGQEKSPSPFIHDLRELFPSLETQEPRSHSEALVPQAEHAACMRDLRNAAFLDAPGLVKIFEEEFKETRAFAEIEKTRHDDSPFGVYDGLLQQPDLLSRIQAGYDSDHAFSVNQLETYANCPFRFFVERLLDLDEAETLDEAFDPRVRGTILHAILEDFHRRYAGAAIPDIPAEEAHEVLLAILLEKFDALAWRSTTAPRGVIEVERTRITAVLERYLHIERARGESEWKPSNFEVAFGRVPGEVADSLSRAEPFALDVGGESVLFAGRIDRVDCSEDAARIIDYKSSSSIQPKDIKEGRSLQLTVYALALQQFLMEGSTCEEAFFLPVGIKKRIEGLARKAKKDGWEMRRETALRVIAESVGGIRNGHFQPTPSEKKSCAYCPASNACRYERARVERKVAP